MVFFFVPFFVVVLFQYPQSDRRRCNDNPGGGRVKVLHPFSILNRIGGDATALKEEEQLLSWSTFSILNRIGGDATIRQIFAASGRGHFQYPQSDRRRCNLRRPVAPTRLQSTFSILNRIGGDATGSRC